MCFQINSVISDYTIKIIEAFSEKKKQGKERKEKGKGHELEYSLCR